MGDLFRIAPLEWRCHRPAGHADGEWWSADTVFGSIDVEDFYGRFRWRYCVDEYYDEGSEECENVEDGKAKAEAWYHGRLKPALTQADGA